MILPPWITERDSRANPDARGISCFFSMRSRGRFYPDSLVDDRLYTDSIEEPRHSSLHFVPCTFHHWDLFHQLRGIGIFTIYRQRAELMNSSHRGTSSFVGLASFNSFAFVPGKRYQKLCSFEALVQLDRNNTAEIFVAIIIFLVYLLVYL